jgi:hypothetical protein
MVWGEPRDTRIHCRQLAAIRGQDLAMAGILVMSSIDCSGANNHFLPDKSDSVFMLVGSGTDNQHCSGATTDFCLRAKLVEGTSHGGIH